MVAFVFSCVVLVVVVVVVVVVAVVVVSLSPPSFEVVLLADLRLGRRAKDGLMSVGVVGSHQLVLLDTTCRGGGCAQLSIVVVLGFCSCSAYASPHCTCVFGLIMLLS